MKLWIVDQYEKVHSVGVMAVAHIAAADDAVEVEAAPPAVLEVADNAVVDIVVGVEFVEVEIAAAVAVVEEEAAGNIAEVLEHHSWDFLDHNSNLVLNDCTSHY